MSNNNIAVIRENLESIKRMKNKDFSNELVIQNEAMNIIETSYFKRLISNLAYSVPYREVYRLNQLLNGVTSFFRIIQSNKMGDLALENILEDNDKMTLRFITSFHFLFGEIQMLMEQDYQLQSFGRLRLVLELKNIYDMCLEHEDMYMDGLESGNYYWGFYENWFGPNLTDETKKFTKYMEDKYKNNELKNLNFWIQKHTGEQYVSSREFKKRNSKDELLMFSWKMCHNFNHAGSMLLALDDKPGLYDGMAKYANQLIMYSIFKIIRLMFDKLKLIRTKEIDELMFKFKMKPFYEIVAEVDEYIDDVLETEKAFLEFINKRRKENKSGPNKD